MAEGGEDTDAAIQTFLNACRLSSPAPAGPLSGTVAVDGPRSRRLNLAGLIGREKFSRREHTSEGLRLCEGVGGGGGATGGEQLMKNYCLDGPSRGPGHKLQQEEGVKWACRHNYCWDIVTE